MKTNDVLLGIMAGKRIEELSEIQQLISNNDAVFEFCFAHGLLRPAPDCACGSGVMHLVCQRARGDGCCWRCPTCSAMNSIRCGSFFARKKLPIAKLLELIFYWASEMFSIDYQLRYFLRRSWFYSLKLFRFSLNVDVFSEFSRLPVVSGVNRCKTPFVQEYHIILYYIGERQMSPIQKVGDKWSTPFVPGKTLVGDVN